MATFRKRAGKWLAEVCVDGKRKARTWPTKAEAKFWAEQAEAQLSKGLKSDEVTNFGHVMSRYADEISPGKKGERWELVRIKAFQRDPIAKVLLKDFARSHIDGYIKRRAAKVGPASINRELNLIAACLTEARRWNLMTQKPMDDLRRPKNPPGRDRRVTQAEIDIICQQAGYIEGFILTSQTQIAAAAFLFAIETGMRAGEICSLMPASVNLEKRTAYLADTKNGSKREVPLNSRAAAILESLKPWPKGPVFRTTSANLSALFRKITRGTTITGLTFHDSRHEAVTRMSKKVDVMTLAKIIGHKNINQLLTYYNESASDIAKRLD